MMDPFVEDTTSDVENHINHVVVVTGASQGIGKAVAELFLEHHYRVFGIDKDKGDWSLVQYMNYFHVKADVRNYKDLPDAENVSILINNAGVQNDDDIDVNLKGLINTTKKYGLQPNIKAIMNVASTSAHTGAEFPEYAASKGGVLSYTKAIANEIAKYGATCNSISPGGVITDLNSPVLQDSDKWQAIMKETPLKKWASAEEIAQWIYFITVYGRSMTGQDIIVDNGEMVNSHFVW